MALAHTTTIAMSYHFAEATMFEAFFQENPSTTKKLQSQTVDVKNGIGRGDGSPSLGFVAWGLQQSPFIWG